MKATPPRSTLSSSSAASDVYKRQDQQEQPVHDPLYPGLSEEEALKIGEQAQHFHHTNRRNEESDPSEFSEGAYYLSVEGKAARSKQESKIRALEEKEFPAAPVYPGLTEEEARSVGEQARLMSGRHPAESIDIQLDSREEIQAKRERRRALQARMMGRLQARAKKQQRGGLPLGINSPMRASEPRTRSGAQKMA
eukprot:TRINITY_DN3474_c0_g1_i2.p1 TRINITY_DN3474_c0_g1~~TRINITY_DN3474_c0_g1_i2.p1  ORF type:complete len:195 (-),score=55.29 TRINITY_DN3474_c0_g1_i2:87-671(-)